MIGIKATGAVEKIHPLTRQYIDDLTEENAKLRDVLKALTVGTNAELCADRDYLSCKECLMHRSRESCTITDAMELLGCDAYGEPMEKVINDGMGQEQAVCAIHCL